jgi:hypothetical protein
MTPEMGICEKLGKRMKDVEKSLKKLLPPRAKVRVCVSGDTYARWEEAVVGQIELQVASY